jgi:hypothetical protein
LIAVLDDAKLIEYSDYLFTSLDSHQLFLACILKHATAIEYLFSMTGLSKQIRPEGLFVELVIRITNTLRSERILLSFGLQNTEIFLLLYYHLSGLLWTYASTQVLE